jgi:hypothetical protein
MNFFFWAQRLILSASKILTIPCESPCIHPEALQGHSSEADSSSSSQDIPHILWCPNVLYRGHKCPPPVTILGAKGSVPVLRYVPVQSCVCFITCSVFRLGFFSPSPNPQAGGPLLARCPGLLISHICSYRPFLEAFSAINNLKTHHAVVRGTI